MSKIEQLKQQFSQYTSIDFIQRNELDLVIIKNDFAIAEIALQGAQVNQFTPINKKPVLFLSDACTYQQSKPLRGGIPICWPWFGDLDKNPEQIQNQFPSSILEQAPAHGFVRDREWELESVAEVVEATKRATKLIFVYENSANEPLFPFAATLRYTVEIGQSLKVSFSVQNNDDTPFYFSQALHSYLAVDNINNTKIHGFNGVTYTDALDNWNEKSQAGAIDFTKEVDRIYHAAPNPIELEAGNQSIKINSSGTNSTVIWNPWIEKSKKLSQFNNEDYKSMVCIESANALLDIVELKENKLHDVVVEFILA